MRDPSPGPREPVRPPTEPQSWSVGPALAGHFLRSRLLIAVGFAGPIVLMIVGAQYLVASWRPFPVLDRSLVVVAAVVAAAFLGRLLALSEATSIEIGEPGVVVSRRTAFRGPRRALWIPWAELRLLPPSGSRVDFSRTLTLTMRGFPRIVVDVDLLQAAALLRAPHTSLSSAAMPRWLARALGA